MQEIWKSVKGYEKLYEVSNLGNVKALKKSWITYNYKSKTRYKITTEERTLKPSTSPCGYKQINLSKNDKAENKLVHRLVAEAFIENKDNKKCVNHIDGNKQNNNVENLEWCTYKENSRHSWDNGLQKSYLKGKYGKFHNVSKCVIQYDKNGNFIKEWDCISDAARSLKIDNAGITRCCKKRCHTAGGYIWEYKKSLLRREDTDGRKVD